MRRIVMLLALLLAVACNGEERWPEKVMRDRAARRVNLEAQSTTVADLAALPVAHPVKGHEPRGVIEAEFRAWTVEGVVIVARRNADQDAHIAIRAEGATLITESAHPACAYGSIVLDQIKAARRQIHAAVGGRDITRSTLARLTGKRVRVTGIGFVDKLHGQEGIAPNGIELHPITAFLVQSK